jgi:hypothetical protein
METTLDPVTLVWAIEVSNHFWPGVSRPSPRHESNNNPPIKWCVLLIFVLESQVLALS